MRKARLFAPIAGALAVLLLAGVGHAFTYSGPVTVGLRPADAAANPVTNRIYVNNMYGGTLTAFDAPLNTPAWTIPVGSSPRGVAVDWIGNRVYVATYAGLAVIDDSPTGPHYLGTVPTPAFGTRVEVDLASPKRLAYMTLFGSNKVAVVDGNLMSLVTTITVGSNPHGIALDLSGRRGFTSNYGSSNVTVFNLDTWATGPTITVGPGPRGVTFDPFLNRIFTANNSGNTISQIDGLSYASSLLISGLPRPSDLEYAGPGRLVITSELGKAYLAISAAPGPPVADVVLPGQPMGLGVNLGTNHAYVANFAGTNVDVIVI